MGSSRNNNELVSSLGIVLIVISRTQEYDLVKKQNRMWLKAAAATVGAGALAFGGVAVPALAADESPEEATTLNLETQKYEAAAKALNISVSQAKASETAGDIGLPDLGGILLKDPEFVSEPATEDTDSDILTLLKKDAGPVPGDPSGGSKPGAPVTIYLDFDGENIAGTSWEDNYDLSEDELELTAASAATPEFQAKVWAGVAEDYAPFNINVTTTDPGEDALVKASESDSEYGTHVVITDSAPAAIATGASGRAPLGGAGSDYLTPALVFVPGTLQPGTDPAQANPRSIADTASHEAGHTFGLNHDGFEADGEDDEYYMPAGVWSPIMGGSYTTPLSQWSNGDYRGATNGEDDLSVMTSVADPGYLLSSVTTQDGERYTDGICVRGDADPQNPKPGDVWFIPNADNLCDPDGEDLVLNWTYMGRADMAADEVGDTADDAAELDNADGTFEAAGIIVDRDDVDAYEFTTAGGTVSAAVAVADFGPNLDTQLQLIDDEGTVIAEDAPETTAPESDPEDAMDSTAPADGLGSSVSADVEAGTYYLLVDGVGQGDPSTATKANSNGYSDYGSLGNYTLSGEAEPFDAEPVAITSPADGDEVELGDGTVAGTGEPGAQVDVSINGTDAATVPVGDDGAWETPVTFEEYGENAITATSKLDDVTIPGEDTVTVTVAVPAPEVTAPGDGDTTDESPTFTVEGEPNADVEVTVTAADDAAAPAAAAVGGTATATTGDDGTATVELDDELAEGDYTVSATQTVNSVESPASDEVSFTVEASDDGDNGDGDDSDNGDADNGDGDDGTGDDGSNDDGSNDDGTTGDDDGSTDDSLAVTGSDFNAAPLGFVALGLLVVGAGTAAFAIRQRKLSMKG